MATATTAKALLKRGTYFTVNNLVLYHIEAIEGNQYLLENVYMKESEWYPLSFFRGMEVRIVTVRAS